MSGKLGAIRHLHKKVIVADGDIFYGPYVPEGEMWWIESSAAFNDTTDNSECKISIERGGTLFPIKQHVNLTVDLWYTKFLRIWMFPGERIAFTWTGVIAADDVQFTCVGHRKIE